ncbi:MAG TPA: DUF3105 domain-containing protein [Nocardioides sp.]|uniref:DUF3105 domain-containing protein n=1 Tax=uncultured Nocardioides sp. TaxID=198441 RepID=UPI000EC66BE9|nr:DUF3105 domain-containing protein [uncultured Nocardioides sp.]HCB05164.1 hypothetical protein [Nocardioides sp.]HRD59950.1 DUF3105 domain-containing protein [Nocardioides sp.]HRI94056.1 DUF3105 domain-containing protein [Nocardioides sp.]HRK44137.1 DUF3105 domain-containing protein [Nocardioides sp.]
MPKKKQPAFGPSNGVHSAADRQAVLDEHRRAHKGSERRRKLIIVVACALVAAGLVSAAAYGPVKDYWDSRSSPDVALADIGTPASSCRTDETTTADVSVDHVPDGQQVIYSSAPPTFGQHWSAVGLAPAPFARKFYGPADRPELEALVHNLEHGYTILWYDETVASDPDQLELIREIADQFQSSNVSGQGKFIAAPWTSQDEAESGTFPDDMHVAFTHWSASAGTAAEVPTQVGVVQYCTEPNGAALISFMQDHPYTDSPEPNAM